MANIILALAVFASAVSAAAVCAGDTYAVGTGSASASTGMTTYNIYTASTCAVYETVSVITSTPCDNPYFHCAAGTTRYDEFDDNESGTSYLLDTDSGESCGSDAILYCAYPGTLPS